MVVNEAGNNVNKLLNRTPRQFAPGFRLAGGLVGAVLGGALGSGVRNTMIANSPAAELLAKAQAGSMTESDMRKLEAVLEATYQQMGLR